MSTTPSRYYLCRHCGSPFSYLKNEYTRLTGLEASSVYFIALLGAELHGVNQHLPPEDQEKILAALSKRSKGNSYRKKGNFVLILIKYVTENNWIF